jgi:diamine N-acetyltransferase
MDGAMPPQMEPIITLRDVTLANARACIGLAVAPDQAGFVATNAESLIQSKFEPHWLTRAIYAADTMVGFVMYGHDPDFGWGVLRLMVDAAFQGRGYGRAALRCVLDDIQAAGAPSVGVSYEDDNQVARRLYSSLGFVETGEQPFGEPFAVLTFPAPAA